MTVPECTLDISNVSHSTSVIMEGGGCVGKPTAVLRDVSARVHGGEVLAVLGSKGSGKRALLDVIAGRAVGEIRGRITLAGSTLNADFCLSTVDRRSRDRFMESNQQISVLVDKFKLEGGLYLREGPQAAASVKETPVGYLHKPCGLGHGIRPGCFSTLLALFLRGMAATFSFNKCGLGHFAARLLLLPFCLALLSVLYSHSSPMQSRVFMQTTGLVFNTLTLFYMAGIGTTALLYPGFRARYYQEKREGLYGGAMFLSSYTLLSLPLSFISTLITVGILTPILELDLVSWAYASGALWASYVAAEQLTIAFFMIIKRPLTGAITVLYITLIALIIGSGGIRSLRSLPDWIAAVSTALPTRYASLAVNQLTIDVPALSGLRYNETLPCPGLPGWCRYPDGKTFLVKRFTREGENTHQVLNVDLNLLISLAFALGFVIFNSILYLLPLPARVKAKFRE
ncbi:uncharacterized protein [Fopius arisanus]|uniref:ABC transporter domain-containing protein n=1 Tax=Fopius arisanus TaxID=64838 RepID=A0A9R1T9M8_9HYME|nr:PREDICTED: uncharacterized protein LOC105267907 [Fopius arisanus]